MSVNRLVNIMAGFTVTPGIRHELLLIPHIFTSRSSSHDNPQETFDSGTANGVVCRHGTRARRD